MTTIDRRFNSNKTVGKRFDTAIRVIEDVVNSKN